jgi:hypothetical protein
MAKEKLGGRASRTATLFCGWRRWIALETRRPGLYAAADGMGVDELSRAIAEYVAIKRMLATEEIRGISAFCSSLVDGVHVVSSTSKLAGITRRERRHTG